MSTALSGTWMGKYSDFLSQMPEVRPKSAIYTLMWDDKQPCRFYMADPHPQGWHPFLNPAV